MKTTGHGDWHNLTTYVARIVEQSEINSGATHVLNVGSTATIKTIEFEPVLKVDLPAILDRLMSPGRDSGHAQIWHDGNAQSHLQATTLGPDITASIFGGRLVLGTWQHIFHLK